MSLFIEYCKKGELINVQNYSGELNSDIIQEGFRYSCEYGHIEVVKYLISLKNEYGPIDIHFSGDYTFRLSCYYGQIEVVKYLCDICDSYDYSIDENTTKITPIILTNEQLIKRVHDRTHKVKNIICKLAQTPDRVTNWFFDVDTIKRLESSFNMSSESRSIRELISELEAFYA